MTTRTLYRSAATLNVTRKLSLRSSTQLLAKRSNRAPGLRDELAAALWLLRAYRQQDTAQTALTKFLSGRVDKLTADQDQDQMRMCELFRLHAEYVARQRGETEAMHEMLALAIGRERQTAKERDALRNDRDRLQRALDDVMASCDAWATQAKHKHDRQRYWLRKWAETQGDLDTVTAERDALQRQLRGDGPGSFILQTYDNVRFRIGPTGLDVVRIPANQPWHDEGSP